MAADSRWLLAKPFEQGRVKVSEYQKQIEEIYRRHGTQSFGSWGAADVHHRYSEKVPPKSRRHCLCGCKKRATHIGMANGVGLVTGCEWRVAKWVRDGQ